MVGSAVEGRGTEVGRAVEGSACKIGSINPKTNIHAPLMDENQMRNTFRTL